MPPYLAFGSNMHRLRLERRVGAVVDHGRVHLPDYRHAFTKLGRDGTGKGNIRPHLGARVYGVLYELSFAQLDVLETYEGGYERVALEVPAAPDQRGERIVALSFVSSMWIHGLAPTDAYLEHYRRGMREHDFPDAYVREVLAAAALASVRIRDVDSPDSVVRRVASKALRRRKGGPLSRRSNAASGPRTSWTDQPP
jgi:gamma-glutamylcyclotransferase